MENQLFQFFTSVDLQNKVFTIKDGSIEVTKGNICLFDLLGNMIDVFWDISKGNMFLRTSTAPGLSYKKIKSFEIFKGIEFRHAHICPYREKQFIKSQKFYKPCACTLLTQQNNHILVTRRKLTLNSFPGAWVLPGGHLQKGQSLIEGGLREAVQQVGLKAEQAQVDLDNGVMAWQSAYFIENKIVSSSLVIFFSSKVQQFEVKAQQAQIEQFIWKDARNHQDQHKYTTEKKNGYGEAHLNYLSFYRLRKYQIEQKKHWISSEKNQDKNQQQSNL